MFASFTRETVLPPSGLTQFSTRWPAQDAAQFEPFQKAHLEDGVDHDLGCGNGMSHCPSSRCEYSREENISCLFAGDAKDLGGFDGVQPQSNGLLKGKAKNTSQSVAALLSNLLQTIPESQLSDDHVVTTQLLLSVGKVTGPFAFVVYDAFTHRVLAARDRQGSQKLYWGVTPQGRVQFASDIRDLAACLPTATAFPAGSIFVSASVSKASSPGPQGWTIDSRMVPGTLSSFVPRLPKPPKADSKADSQPASFRSVRAVPRINSQGCLCGAVYRVASDQSLSDWGATY